ncbi:MAG: hypothetical protein ACXAD7_16835 [Candidatus Kariarchaeaceae archaeon]|jgi:hypothetical protein
MPSLRETKYQCSVCTQIRDVGIDSVAHNELISLSANGLAIYSDIHRCEHGILGINNLHIDHDFAIRSFDNLQLPKKRVPKKSIPGLPIPGIPTTRIDERGGMRTYRIINPISMGKRNYEKEIRIRIVDERLRAVIVIGKIDLSIPKKEKMIALITSDLGTIELEFYSSKTRFNTNMEKWFTIMVNLLEKLPPTTTGLFLETVRFIQSLNYAPPSIFLIKQLQTIITSHETYFQLNAEPQDVTDKLTFIAAKYGEEVAIVMNELISYLVANPLIPLQYYTRTHSEDLVYLINMFLILEQEELLSIERPGIVEEKVNKELAVDEYERFYD